MGNWVRSLHPAVEFAVVVLVAFGTALLDSFASAQQPDVVPVFDTANLWYTSIWQIGVMIALGWFLLVRRWDFARQALYPSWVEMFQGAALAIAIMLAWPMLWQVLVVALPSPMLTVTPFELGKIDWLTLIVSSTVNPVFEEIFVCAYIISALRKPLGINLAVAVSVAIRAAYHTYQGAPGFFYAALVGVIFGVWFASTNRLWPVILAHIVWDFIPLLPGVLQ